MPFGKVGTGTYCHLFLNISTHLLDYFELIFHDVNLCCLEDLRSCTLPNVCLH